MSSFIRDEKGRAYAYKCDCGKVTSLLDIESLRIDTTLIYGEGFCMHCIRKVFRPTIPVPLPRILSVVAKDK